MANEKRLISCCGDCIYYSNKRHKCTICNCEESDPRNPFYDDCPLPKGEEVVYCKDCKYCLLDLSGQGYHLCMRAEYALPVRGHRKADDFCSYGERRCGDGEKEGT